LPTTDADDVRVLSPVILPEAQVALALKTLCGLGNRNQSRIHHHGGGDSKRTHSRKAADQEARVPLKIPPATSWRGGLESVSRPCICCFKKGTKSLQWRQTGS